MPPFFATDDEVDEVDRMNRPRCNPPLSPFSLFNLVFFFLPFCWYDASVACRSLRVCKSNGDCRMEHNNAICGGIAFMGSSQVGTCEMSLSLGLLSFDVQS